MKFETRRKLTIGLVGLSIICSFGSLVLSSMDKGEIYPFFHFKLFSQPLGSKNTVTEFRIYTRSKNSSTFERQAIRETEAYDYNAYALSFNHMIKDYLKNTPDQEEYKKKILLFAKHIVPNKEEYKIIAETYHPLDIVKNNQYDTTTVIRF